MKGFPNQVTSINKLTTALGILSNIIDAGGQHDDDSFGEALLRGGVINPGSGYADVDAYLQATRLKSPSNQSHRTSARGLKEFLNKADLTHISAEMFNLTAAGRHLLEVFGTNDVDSLNSEWKMVARNIWAIDSEGNISHPYRVMLRLLTARPGTPRAYCALALEAKDDSETELQRILALRDLDDEEGIRNSIGITKSNWDNAKKILPSIAEQISDVARGLDGLFVVDAGLRIDLADRESTERVTARRVTAQTIAALKVADDSDEVEPMKEPDLVSLADAIAKRADRSFRHNVLVRRFAGELTDAGVELWEGLFDCLAVNQTAVVLAEIKTLDGSVLDEVHQVRNAVAQLLYYERLAMPTEVLAMDLPLIKVAVFDSMPSQVHLRWIDDLDIRVVWSQGGSFATTDSSKEVMSRHIRLQG